MTDHHFHDGIYHAANRTNEASGRSWHIPAESRRYGFVVWTALSLVVCSLPAVLIAALWS